MLASVWELQLVVGSCMIPGAPIVTDAEEIAQEQREAEQAFRVNISRNNNGSNNTSQDETRRVRGLEPPRQGGANRTKATATAAAASTTDQHAETYSRHESLAVARGPCCAPRRLEYLLHAGDEAKKRVVQQPGVHPGKALHLRTNLVTKAPTG